MLSTQLAQYTACWDQGRATEKHNLPLILIHGLGLDHHCFNGMVPALAQTHRVITFDLAGHGETPCVDDERPSLDLFARQTLEVMNRLGIDQAVLIGFSLGGMINRRFAIDYPDRVKGLVIMNSPHDRGKAGQKAVEERAIKTRDEGVEATMDATLSRWYTAAFRADHPDVMQNTAKQLQQNEPNWYADCRFVLAAGVKELIRPQPPIQCPSLVMTCEHDSGSTVSMSQAIANEITPSETVIIPNLQHLGLIEAPSLFSDAIIRYLRAYQL
ncbi:MAG: alpha/beta hydrolase [Proteobacteria bacterium]|nr:alpha/beta hydrolase [Pseudomonadota bacterium]